MHPECLNETDLGVNDGNCSFESGCVFTKTNVLFVDDEDASSDISSIPEEHVSFQMNQPFGEQCDASPFDDVSFEIQQTQENEISSHHQSCASSLVSEPSINFCVDDDEEIMHQDINNHFFTCNDNESTSSSCFSGLPNDLCEMSSSSSCETENLSETTRFQDSSIHQEVSQCLYEKHLRFLADESSNKDKFAHATICQDASFQLLLLLKESGAPLHMCDKLLEWAKKCSVNGVFDNQCDGLLSRSSAVAELRKRTNLSKFKPKMSSVHLPNANTNVNVTTFDFQESLYSLLTCPHLNKDENYDFPVPNQPFKRPPKWSELPDDHVVRELSSGKRFIDTHHLLVQNENDEMLVPIILFEDATHIDNNGRLKSEPVLFTLGWFNEKMRQDPRAWRPLGYVPTSGTYLASRKTVGRHSDHHVILKHILKDLWKDHPSGFPRFRWDFRLNNQTHDVILLMPVILVTGDNEGQDKMCGKKSKSNHPCRRCKVNFEQLDNHHKSFQIHKPQKNNMHHTENHGCHVLTHGNAFNNLHYGSGNDKGINGATPFDILHTKNKGLDDRLKEGLFSMHRQKKSDSCESENVLSMVNGGSKKTN